MNGLVVARILYQLVGVKENGVVIIMIVAVDLALGNWMFVEQVIAQRILRPLNRQQPPRPLFRLHSPQQPLQPSIPHVNQRPNHRQHPLQLSYQHLSQPLPNPQPFNQLTNPQSPHPTHLPYPLPYSHPIPLQFTHQTPLQTVLLYPLPDRTVVKQRQLVLLSILMSIAQNLIPNRPGNVRKELVGNIE